ncbi:hypothetical protein ACFY1P_07335 [Streptomyces sp. NPDC001407]|uniref:hypothetical protein n=1 Tax=unclassified Streptomyces TaxID=2593676 RepID=UPI0033D8A7AD
MKSRTSAAAGGAGPGRPVKSDGTFPDPLYILDDFGVDQGWTGKKHPRFLADITGDGRADIVGFGGPGVYVARNLYRHFRTR